MNLFKFRWSRMNGNSLPIGLAREKCHLIYSTSASKFIIWNLFSPIDVFIIAILCTQACETIILSIHSLGLCLTLPCAHRFCCTMKLLERIANHGCHLVTSLKRPRGLIRPRDGIINRWHSNFVPQHSYFLLTYYYYKRRCQEHGADD